MSLNEIDSQLAEIDENLMRNELKVLERSEQLERRKRLYEVKHPETKHGASGGRGNAKTKENETRKLRVSFSKDTAVKTNQHEATIRRDVQIANKIPKGVRDAIRSTPAADHQDGLLKLARLPKETQVKVAEKIQTGKATTVKELRPHLHRIALQQKILTLPAQYIADSTQGKSGAECHCHCVPAAVSLAIGLGFRSKT